MKRRVKGFTRRGEPRQGTAHSLLTFLFTPSIDRAAILNDLKHLAVGF